MAEFKAKRVLQKPEIPEANTLYFVQDGDLHYQLFITGSDNTLRDLSIDVEFDFNSLPVYNPSQGDQPLYVDSTGNLYKASVAAQGNVAYAPAGSVIEVTPNTPFEVTVDGLYTLFVDTSAMTSTTDSKNNYPDLAWNRPIVLYRKLSTPDTYAVHDALYYQDLTGYTNNNKIKQNVRTLFLFPGTYVLACRYTGVDSVLIRKNAYVV